MSIITAIAPKEIYTSAKPLKQKMQIN